MAALIFSLMVFDSNAASKGGKKEKPPEPKPAKVKVSGYHFFGNFELKRMLKLLEAEGRKPEFFDANFIEDSAVLLMSRLTQDGFLRPEVSAQITLADGRKISYRWRQLIEEPLPRPLLAKRVQFILKRGVRYFYKQVEFEGLKSLKTKEALNYFQQTAALVSLKRYRIYSPAQLKRSLDNLSEVLERKGFRQVKVSVAHLAQDDRTGAVRLRVKIDEGLKSIVRSVREEIFSAETNAPSQITVLHPQKPFSPIWEQDFVQGLKTNFYHHGFPDTAVKLSTVKQEQQTNSIQVDLRAQVQTGPQIHLGGVGFEGAKKTKESVMRRRVRLKPGELLDVIQVERSRYRLSRLGVFDSVGVRYDLSDEEKRNVIFLVKESKELEASMLFGFGTYELLRVGFEIDQHNIFGRAHNAHFRVAQSFKSTSGDYIYTLPEFIGEDVNVFFNASALRRQEISFLREEYGGGVGAEKFFRSISTDLSVRYNYQLLTASETKVDVAAGLRSAQVSGFIIDVKHDRRDHPLYPRRGYKIFGNFEVASAALGGEVDYQRFEMNSSYHFGVGGGRWLHFALNHGFVFTDRAPQFDLPFNKRFFPGGENSVRGYTQGEAAPRNAQGLVIGAESYLLGTIELEQELTPKLSLVTFVDSVGLARDIKNYPVSEVLISVGGGLGWKTLIGPVRLEYGYNLRQRAHDPIGTVQFSVGFPF